jgi:hypothetical protein
MKPLVPTRGTGKPFGFLIAMAGVSRAVLLAGGRHPLLPVDAAEIVCSFLHLRPTRAFNLMPRMPMVGGVIDLSLCCLLDNLYRIIYIDHAFDDQGRAIRDDQGVKYAVTVIQSIGVGTEWGQVLLQSVFCAPGAASAAPCVNRSSPSPHHRLRQLLRDAMSWLELYMFHPNQLVGVNYIELRADFVHLEDILCVESGEGWWTEGDGSDREMTLEDEEAMEEWMHANQSPLHDDADYYQDQLERLADRYY